MGGGNKRGRGKKGGKAGVPTTEECTGGVDLKPKKVFLRLSRRSCGDQGKKGKEREVAEALLRCKGTHSQRGGSARLMAEE